MNTDGRRIVLIIGENDELRSFARSTLLKNFDIAEVISATQGLEIARKIQPDLVLCDVSVFFNEGLEVCRLLKIDVATSHIFIILLTSVVSHEIEGLRAGADDCIARGFDDYVLELKIDNLMRMRETLRSQFVQLVSLNQKPSELDGGFIERLREVVSNNISDSNFGVHEMAFQIGISVSVLYRRLRLLMGVTVNDFVKTIRMERAVQLLEIGIYQVNEVAQAVGYEDTKYFSREFRKAHGRTPTEVKRKL